MQRDTTFQSKDTQHNSTWGWYEEDLQPRHRLMGDSRFSDGGLGPRSARPSFDPQPAVYHMS